MEKIKQLLSDDWYVLPDGETVGKKSALPALLKDLFPKHTGAVRYFKNFECELSFDKNERVYLCFDRVVCGCKVWLNEKFIAKHVHSEQKFELDVTDALNNGENRLEIQVEPIDPKNMPNYAQVYSYYTVISLTGIYGSVSLCKKPACRITDLYLCPDLKSKKLSIELSLENAKDDCDVEMEYQVFDKGINTLSFKRRVFLNKTAVYNTELTFDQIKPWSPNNPYLYDIVVSVSANGKTDTVKKRFGFKSLYVKDGFFVLNGERIFLTCAHALESKEAIVHAKTMGFKALRYLSAMPSEETLDFCDEIGMLVYEECAAAWGMQDYDGMEKDMSAYLDNMILRDRSHVSVGIWGIFNEQAGPNKVMKSSRISDTSKVFDFAVSYLPKMRKLDNQRLILLSSGRWDARADIGSFSNPGSDSWNFGWGKEKNGAKNCDFKKSPQDIDPYIEGLGDVHLYPTVPIQKDVREFVRNIAKDTNPVFLSEYGVGYQLELYDLYYNLVKTAHTEHPSIEYYNVQIQKLEQWIEKYSLQKVYPTARDFLMASINAGANQRRESIDPVRANPNLCGYSLTSFSVGNEGVYFRNGGFIPGVVDAIRESFAPLKWSIFMDKTELYEKDTLEIELVLCNEDLLDAGKYTAVASVTGKEGIVYSKKVSFEYPEGKPLAASVLKLSIDGLKEGEYTFSICVDGIVQPTCNTKKFRVYSLDTLEKLSKSFYPIGDMYAVCEFLCKMGMTVAKSAKDADIIVVGRLCDGENPEQILDMAHSGKRVVIIDYNFFESANTSAQEFMNSIDFKEGSLSVFGNCIYVRNWLYHLDNYIADKNIFDGVSNVGIVDMEIFREVYPDHYFTDTAVPQKTVCAAFGSGLFAKDNCISALTMGEFELGRGRVFVNTFKLMKNVGNNPVADRILYNIFKA